ncbi:hypothetical protein NPIL_562831 [Nephila pilipes]|uniref:Uncharacterized protein n=1 Tax=Nephila pilipes TaxID=299642 RepID=A0A8X6QS75_NEPPI|nr:hypothetical protein NPIL_562831 [Nephila pilipes]
MNHVDLQYPVAMTTAIHMPSCISHGSFHKGKPCYTEIARECVCHRRGGKGLTPCVHCKQPDRAPGWKVGKIWFYPGKQSRSVLTQVDKWKNPFSRNCEASTANF